MLFSSLTFIFYFLPLCLLFYFIIPNKYMKIKNIVLLIFSLVFYAWGEPKYIFLMLLTVFISFIFGKLIDYFDKNNNLICKKIAFIVSIVLILGSLGYFKYFNFLISNINKVFNLNFRMMNIVLPVGISFYTFQILTYLIDLYRKKIKVQNNFFNLSLYISFFPQLIAGPIVTYESVENQLSSRVINFDKIVNGVERFIIGLGKKVIIANRMAVIADTFYNSSVLKDYSIVIIILGVLAYTFQIYFDFSGYSDMAIGLGKIVGFEFYENFNYPYIARSVNDFWKRWHISLTKFFREYVYIPLGGNRVSKKRWIFNIFAVWFLTGLWHGAAWNFVLWGLYFCIILILEKSLLKKIKIPFIIGYIYTFILINIGWVLFRINSLSDILLIIKHNSTIGLKDFINSNPDIVVAILMMPFAFFFSLNIMKKLDEKCKNNIIYNLFKRIALLGIFAISIVYLVSSKYNPFIYFRF